MDSNGSVTRLNQNDCGDGTGTAWGERAPRTERGLLLPSPTIAKTEKKDGYFHNKENTEPILFVTTNENFNNFSTQAFG